MSSPENNGLVFDSSTLTTFERCPRLFYWRYVRHLSPVDVQIPLSYGSALHEALHVWHDTHDIEEAVAMFHAHWTDLEHEKDRTADNGELLLRGYARKYAKEPFKIVSLEKHFDLPLGTYQYCGRFDAVVHWDGQYYVMDHKHTKRLYGNYFRQYRPNLQMSGYAWAAQRIFDVPIAGLVINLIHVTQKTVKGIDQGEPYQRAFVSREPWELDEFEQIAHALMDRAVNLDQEDRHAWPMCWSACNDYGGCSYRDLCMDTDPDSILDTQFVVRKWSPLDELTNPERQTLNKKHVRSLPKFWEI